MIKHTLQNALNILTQKERRAFYLFIILNIVISIADILSLSILVLLVSFYTSGVPDHHWLISFGWLLNDHSVLPVSVFLFLFIFKSIAGYLVFASQYRYVYKVASRISRENLLHYLQGNYADYVHTDSSVYIRKILHQPIEFSHYVLFGAQQMITELMLSFFTIIAVVLFNVKLFVLLVIALAPPLIIVAYFTKKKLRHARANVKSTNEKTLQHLQEALSGYIESSIYGKEQFFAERYANQNDKFSGYLSDVQIAQGMSSRFIEVFAVLGLFVLILISKTMAGPSVIALINIGAFMAAAYKLIPGIVKISNIGSQIKTYAYTIADLMRTQEFISRETDLEITKISSVQFRKVSFNYNSNAVLTDLSFNIAPGDFIGIYGASGKGKTTLLHLLLGFLQQNDGTILINDMPANNNARQQYRTRIAYSPQRPFLIYDSIQINITLSDEYDEERLAEVVGIAGLKEFFSGSNGKLIEPITENGKNVSGGQRQRIALARALYKGTDLIILDEPLSELDSVSQQQILEHLKKMAADGKMIIMVTHNKDNLAYCNKSYLIE